MKHYKSIFRRVVKKSMTQHFTQGYVIISDFLKLVIIPIAIQSQRSHQTLIKHYYIEFRHKNNPAPIFPEICNDPAAMRSPLFLPHV